MYPTESIGSIVAADFRTATVFEKHGIDFCCGGKVLFSEACLSKGLDPQAVADELAVVQQTAIGRNQNYAAWPASFLADYIVNVHHGYLDEATEPLLGYVRKIAQVHGANHPELLEIAEIFTRAAADLGMHLREEESVLFPAIKRLEATRKAGGIPAPKDVSIVRTELAKLEAEHDAVGDGFHRIRRLASGYTLPPDACTTFRLAYQKLQEFEDDLHRHVHLENNILFPKLAVLCS